MEYHRFNAYEWIRKKCRSEEMGRRPTSISHGLINAATFRGCRKKGLAADGAPKAIHGLSGRSAHSRVPATLEGTKRTARKLLVPEQMWLVPFEEFTDVQTPSLKGQILGIVLPGKTSTNVLGGSSLKPQFLIWGKRPS